jgi:DNA polymerase III epsilon subunit-like protein
VADDRTLGQVLRESKETATTEVKRSMSGRIVFLDTETTSLRPDRRAWEIGLIARSEDGTLDDEHHWFIYTEDLDLGNADLMSLKIGRFYERHPEFADVVERAKSEEYVLRRVEKLTRGAHLVGAVPNFDADVLSARMRAHGICPSWHYHLIDIEALAVGYMHGLNRHGHSSASCAEGFCVDDDQLPGLPWKSDDLSAALGIKVSDEDRHTALGDAKWARAIYNAVTGNG